MMRNITYTSDKIGLLQALVHKLLNKRSGKNERLLNFK